MSKLAMFVMRFVPVMAAGVIALGQIGGIGGRKW